MLRIAVVEDDMSMQRQIKDYLCKYEAESGEQFDVYFFSDGDEIIYEYKAVYDIIFLDIIMKRLDGMTTAVKIREMDSDVILIFITNTSNYAIEGYSVGAFDYILKPVSYFAFSQQLKRAVSQLAKSKTHYMVVPIEGGMIRLVVTDIFYIESYGHKLTLYTESEVYSFTGPTMKKLEKELMPYGFFRCNHGYLVNLSRVSGVIHNIAVVGKYEVLISRPKKKLFMDALADYIGWRVK